MGRHQNKYPKDCGDLGVTASSGDLLWTSVQAYETEGDHH